MAGRPGPWSIVLPALLAACAGGTDTRDATVADHPSTDTGRPATDAVTPAGDGGPLVPGPDGGHHPDNDGRCRYARATNYPIYRMGGVPYGTCNFGPVADRMPRIFRDGYVTAPNEVFYHRTPSLAGACGECFELTGPRGTMTVIVADICDIACCDNCRGDVVAFDLEQQRWRELVDQGGGNVSVAYRWVPCPVEGPIRAYFTGGYQAGDRFRLVPYHYRVGVARIEVRGQPGGATHGEWQALARTQDNYFDWTGANVGLPIQLRAVSTQGQVVSFPELSALSSNLQITAGGQFDNLEDTSHGTCAWPGPQAVIYDDRLGGILGLQWRDWGSYMLVDGMPDYASHAGCQAGTSCIAVGAMNGWGAIQIGYPNQFPPGLVQGIEFWARTDGAAYTGLKFYFNGDNATGMAARSDMVDLAVTGTWQRFRVDFAPITARVAWMQVVRVTNQSNQRSPRVFLDEIRLIPR